PRYIPTPVVSWQIPSSQQAGPTGEMPRTHVLAAQQVHAPDDEGELQPSGNGIGVPTQIPGSAPSHCSNSSATPLPHTPGTKLDVVVDVVVSVVVGAVQIAGAGQRV